MENEEKGRRKTKKRGRRSRGREKGEGEKIGRVRKV